MKTKDLKKISFCSLIISISVGLVLCSLAGCLVRTYPKTIERVDLDIRGQGNEGYIYGIPPAGRTKIEKETREIQVFELELGKPLKTFKGEPQSKVTGYQEQEPWQEDFTYVEETVEPEFEKIVYAEEIHKEASQQLPDTYVVQANDTLQNIAARPEIYGSYKKWRKIYDANRDKLSAPSKIYPGQT